ncbi:MAG: NAD(P)/FAD-dependent oxidoreductase [Chitinophagaceae bacterium]
MSKTAIIIGAGPAGLTAAYELLTKTDIIPVILEADSQVGGLSKTINYKGNKIDIGGHRFFSKSQRVINWWLHFLPLDAAAKQQHIDIQYQHNHAAFDIPAAFVGRGDNIMMVRPRKSRIYYQRKFFDYPLQLNGKTIANLGLLKMMRIGNSYAYAKLFPVKPEDNLAQFFSNRFGKELYETFFKDYTEKVWGVPCEKIPASWGQQRIKDLNVSKVLRHAITALFSSNKTIQQKGTSTSLIEQFLYPKFGPGQMWETVAAEVQRLGGTILLNTQLKHLYGNNAQQLTRASATNLVTGETTDWNADYFFSSMPVKELFAQLRNIPVAANVQAIAQQLEYRDFLIVGILASDLVVKESNGTGLVKDNWIYIQDSKVKAGRIQVFNNWSPFMVADPGKVWLGVEYFCNETDDFWQQDDKVIAAAAVKEMASIGILDPAQVEDCMVARVKKAYPSYYGSYNNFNVVQQFTDTIENLFLIGRNGMHRYNNSDHSMLTAMTAVENIMNGRKDKGNIWSINTEESYHEEESKAD